MNNDVAIAWLDGIRTNVEEAEPREALLKGIEAIEKIEQINQIMIEWDDIVEGKKNGYGAPAYMRKIKKVLEQMESEDNNGSN